MTITWREREHSAIDNHVMEDKNALDALRGYGSLKKFKIPNIKDNTRLLELLIHYWSAEDDALMIDQMPLRIEIEDIYFTTGLSRSREVVHSTGKMRGSLMIEDCVHIYYPGHPEKIGSHIPIKHVESLSLKILFFTISREIVIMIYIRPQVYP